MLDREAIMVALFAQLNGQVTGVKKSTRLALDWDAFPPEVQPAMVVVQRDSTPDEEESLPPRWLLDVEVWFYVRTPQDPETSPDATMNELLEQLEGALARQSGESGPGDEYSTTLGGLVEWCRISGQVTYTQNHQGGQSVARIPVQLLAIESD